MVINSHPLYQLSYRGMRRRVYDSAAASVNGAAGLRGSPRRASPCAPSPRLSGGLGVPVRSIPADQAAAQFDWMARFVAIDNPTSSALTRQTLGWTPDHPGLLTDLVEAGYLTSTG